jgi:2-keto-3-deoxy-L-rhamnonate aldolase RhmA
MGSFDLAQAMGFDGDITQGEVQREVSRVLALASKHGVDLVANMFAISPQQLADDGARWVEAGAAILCVGSDRRMFVHALASRAEAIAERRLSRSPKRTAVFVEAIRSLP